MMIPPMASSILETIGGTPLVRLERYCQDCDGVILAKLEDRNPTLSKKDRIALQIIKDAMEDGRLVAGQTVLELTSGNTGTSLAMVCAVLKHPFIAVMSQGNSEERARMMRAYGARVVLVDQAAGSRPGQVSGEDLALVDKEATRLTKELGAFRADQFHNASNWRGYYLNAAREIYEQTQGRLDAFCDFVGTGGSFGGTARAFKELDGSIGCYIVEPRGIEALSGQSVVRSGHSIQGGGYAMSELEQLDKSLCDGYLSVDDDEAVESTRELARTEGIFAGFSAGANCAAARNLLRSEVLGCGARIVVYVCDSGLKYLSTNLWSQLD